MTDFDYNDSYRLVDPFAVSGDDQLYLLIDYFNAMSDDTAGLRGQGSILFEAQDCLSPGHFKHFCDYIGMPAGSSGFEILDLVGERFRQEGVPFDAPLWAGALIQISEKQRDDTLKEMLEIGGRDHVRGEPRAA
jgi:hypothetical protein